MTALEDAYFFIAALNDDHSHNPSIDDKIKLLTIGLFVIATSTVFYVSLEFVECS